MPTQTTYQANVSFLSSPFMSVDEFLHLLHRYSRQDCSPDEIELIDRWYDRLRANLEPQLSLDERAILQRYLWQRIERRIEASMEADEPISPPIGALRRLWPVRPWVVAAAVVVLLGVGTTLSYWFGGLSIGGLGSRGVREVVSALSGTSPTEWKNTTRQPQLITLTDGSTVQLEPGASLQAPAKPGAQTREVWLTGRAFFTVKRDTLRPFLVYTGSVLTRVLGTSFWVNAPANALAVDVSVRTGRVWVARQTAAPALVQETTPKGQGVVLTPNQRVTFYTTKSQWAMGLVAQPHPLELENIPVSAPFIFDETPLCDVFKSFDNQYGITVSAPDKTLANCRFTGDISQQDFYTQLELVCRSINASYEVIGTRIVISGPGCYAIL